jgi:hypothetical protein
MDYEKLIRIINNKHVKGLEKMISRLEIEIEDAEDRRYKNKRSRDLLASEENKTIKQKLETPQTDFEKLLSYLNEELKNLGNGLEDEYKIVIDENGELKPYDITFSYDMDAETLEVNYYEEDEETVIRREEIKDLSDADRIIEDIEAAEKIGSSEKIERYKAKLLKEFTSKLDVFFKKSSKDIQEKIGDELIDSYRKDPRAFSEKAIETILKDPDIYKEKIKAIEKGISDTNLIDLLVQLREELKTGILIDPGKEFAKAEKLFTEFDQILVNQSKERNLDEKDWKILLSDIVFSSSNNMISTIERFIKLPEIKKERKIKALSNAKRVIKLLNYSAKNDPKGKSAEVINKIKKYLGSESIRNILNESFISFEKYKI